MVALAEVVFRAQSHAFDVSSATTKGIRALSNNRRVGRMTCEEHLREEQGPRNNMIGGAAEATL